MHLWDISKYHISRHTRPQLFKFSIPNWSKLQKHREYKTSNSWKIYKNDTWLTAEQGEWEAMITVFVFVFLFFVLFLFCFFKIYECNTNAICNPSHPTLKEIRLRINKKRNHQKKLSSTTKFLGKSWDYYMWYVIGLQKLQRKHSSILPDYHYMILTYWSPWGNPPCSQCGSASIFRRGRPWWRCWDLTMRLPGDTGRMATVWDEIQPSSARDEPRALHW